MTDRPNRHLLLSITIAFQLSGWLPSAAAGSVSFFGSVNPDPPGDGNVESTLFVGLLGDDDPSPFGYVQIDGGTQIEYDALNIGDDLGFQGQVVLRGSPLPGGQTILTLEEAGSVSASTARVGREGTGHLTIESGAQLVFTNTSADLTIGVEPTGVGTMIVTGAFSTVRVPDVIRVGDDGNGRLEILDGGLVHSTDLIGTVIIGGTSTGVGAVLVDGDGSTFRIDDNLTIGSQGEATLTIRGLSRVDVDQPGAITTVGVEGRLELEHGGIFEGALVNLNGYLGGDGLIRGSVTGAAGSSVEVPLGSRLRFADAVNNDGFMRVNGELDFDGSATNLASGEIFADSGTVDFDAGITNFGDLTVIGGRLTSTGNSTNAATGRIQGRNANLNFSGGLTNTGELQLSFGTADIFGVITNDVSGAIINSGSGNATFFDSLQNDGELRTSTDSQSVFFGEYTGTGALTGSGLNSFEGGFSPGASPFLATSMADVVFGGGNVTTIELAGPTRGASSSSEFDGLDVLNGKSLTLGGTLEVVLIDDLTPDYSPSENDVFVLFTAGTIVGDFASTNLPVLDGDLAWSTQNDGQNYTLRVVPEPSTVSMLIAGLLFFCAAARRTPRVPERGKNGPLPQP